MQWGPPSPGRSSGSALTQRVHAQPPLCQVTSPLSTDSWNFPPSACRHQLVPHSFESAALAQGSGMEVGACKGKENAGVNAPCGAARDDLVAAADSASCADQPAEGAAQPEASSADDLTSQLARSKSAAPESAAAPAPRELEPTPRTADIVDLTSDDEHSVQQSRSTGDGRTLDPSSQKDTPPAPELMASSSSLLGPQN